MLDSINRVVAFMRTNVLIDFDVRPDRQGRSEAVVPVFFEIVFELTDLRPRPFAANAVRQTVMVVETDSAFRS